jgi:lysozyme family protein
MNFLYITTHYEDHFNNMIICEDSRPQIIECAKRIKSGMSMYNEVSNQINPKIPWYFIGIIHMMAWDMQNVVCFHLTYGVARSIIIAASMFLMVILIRMR